MSKLKVVYICENCKYQNRKSLPKCPQCGEQYSFELTKVPESELQGNKKSSAGSGLKTGGAITPTNKARTFKELKSTPIKRTPTGIYELDRVLGGGFVDSEIVLFSGVPGSGKSSLSLHIADKYAQMGKTVLYSSGEESEQQIGLRAERFGVDSENIHVIQEFNLETLLGHIDELKPDFIVVDSLQTITSNEVSGSMGSISQSKEAANVLTRTAKTQGITMLLVSQVNKSGDFAGSESIQHIVDATLFLESEPESPLKFLRAFKNRFGDTTEVGVFQHAENGLIEVTDPSGVFIDTSAEDSIGSAVGIISEGVRSIPVEIQALTTPSSASFPRRQFSGIDFNRAQIVCAIADKHAYARIAEKDVYLSTLSGVKINDPQTDLALVAAILSTARNAPFRDGSIRVAFVGEVGLNGVVRGGMMIENKIKEAARLGFDEIVVPKKRIDKRSLKNVDIKVTEISYVSEITKFFKKKTNSIINALED